MAENYSAVLVATATATDIRTGQLAMELSAEQMAKLKKALEIGGAMVAINGGEFLGIYDRPGPALQAAISFQQTAEGFNSQSVNYHGRVVLEAWPSSADNVPVDRVHEILAHTQDGCVLTTPVFSDNLDPEFRSHLMAAGGETDGPLKGIREYPWKESATTYRERTRVINASTPAELYASVTLARREKVVEVNPKDCPFSMGRDSTCAMALGGTSVSRFHGELQYENGKFYYCDLSRNGSYLTSAGEEIFLQQERFPLVSKGVISPGAPLIEQTGDVIKYQCNAFGSRGAKP